MLVFLLVDQRVVDVLRTRLVSNEHVRMRDVCSMVEAVLGVR